MIKKIFFYPNFGKLNNIDHLCKPTEFISKHLPYIKEAMGVK